MKENGQDPHFPVAVTTEENGEISCSVEETNRVRKLLGLKPLKIEKKETKQEVVAQVTEVNGEISCSVEETNRIRAALGLKPLRVDKKVEERPVKRAKVESPKADEVVKQRIEQARKKRALKTKLQGKTLGDETERDGESALDWLSRSDTIIKQNLKSEEDVEKPKTKKRKKLVTSNPSIKVAHAVEDITAKGGDREMILTLKDSRIINAETGELEEEDVDELENARLADEEKTKKRLDRLNKKKKNKTLSLDDDSFSGNKAFAKFDQVMEEEGYVKRRKTEAKAVLGVDGTLQNHGNAKKSLEEMIDEKLKEQQRALNVQDEPGFQESQDFYDVDEYETLNLKPGKKDKKKKKKEKKKKKKKIKKQDDDEDEEDDGVILRRKKKKDKGKLAEEYFEDEDPEEGLSNALANARRLALSKGVTSAGDSETIADLIKQEDDSEMQDAEQQEEADGLVLSSMSGFTSRIGSLVADEKEEEEEETIQRRTREKTKASSSGIVAASSSSSSSSSAPGKNKKQHSILGDEYLYEKSDVNSDDTGGRGVASVLKYLSQRSDVGGSKQAEVMVGRATDRKQELDDGTGGFVLEYRDEKGRLLTKDEAWRQMSYKFYGQKPGFNKIKKRERELERQAKMYSDKEK